MKFLIISVYIAGATSSENDIKKFTPSEQGKRKRSKHSEKGDSEHGSGGGSGGKKSSNSGVFGLQRLLAIFGFLLEDFGGSLDGENSSSGSSKVNKRRYLYGDTYSGVTMVHIAELVHLSLLERNYRGNSVSDVLSEPSYNSLVGRELAYFLAAQLKINLEKYL
jgi:hypothetical protein